jgi:hypothetical protein
MPFQRDPPIRWSLHKAEVEYGRSVLRIKSGLRAAGISPGADGKYSTREIAEALFGFGTLERRAREAKMNQQIDEARLARSKLLQHEGALLPIAILKFCIADVLTNVVTFIRHSSLTKEESERLVSQLRHYKVLDEEGLRKVKVPEAYGKTP